ncbi:MAG: hypothetical protein JNG88_00505 [Phycisphaerales bacterium]|nr:hypothetical protein [Phycisphaerales bacterium]
MSQNNRYQMVAIAIFAACAFAVTAYGGPPLLCHPYEIGDAKSLPWGGGAFDRNKKYDTAELIPDTLALLGDQTPLLERMETVRRAAIYANSEPSRKCAELTKALDSRRGETLRPDAPKNTKVMRDFDYWLAAGAIAQFSYRDGAPANRRAAYDGAIKSLGDTPRTAEIEFALAVLSWDLQIAEHHGHVAAACDQTAEDSLLAANIRSRFADGAKSLKEIRENHAKKAR